MEMLNGKKVLHVGIAVPSLDMWFADFALSLISTVVDLKNTPIPGYDMVGVHVLNQRSSSISQLRQGLTEEAQNQKCDYLVFVDSDQTIPKDAVRRLIASGKDVIGANIAVKRIPSLPTARRFTPAYPLVGDIVYTKPDSTGLEKIWKLGFGLMLIKMDVFDKLSKPYYNFSYNEQTGFVGEDWYFCEKLTQAGIELWIDHDVSKQVGHIGSHLYTHDDVDFTEQALKIVRPGDTLSSRMNNNIIGIQHEQT